VSRFALLIALSLSFAIPTFAQSPETPSIVAQGEATIRRAADVGWVQIAVEARGTTPDAARSAAASAMTSVMGVLQKALPADAVRTSRFTVQPEMEYPNNTPKVRDYVARNQVEARVDDLATLPAVLDASLSSGATSVAGLRFDLKNHDDVEREALQLAVQDAMGRAEAIASGAKRTLGGILRLTEQRSSPGSIQPMAFAARAGAPPTPVAPGEVEIRASVSLTVAIK
jgi:uncharacterized protein YggE